MRGYMRDNRRWAIFWGLSVLFLSIDISPAQAEVYKFVKDGVVNYSNRPPANSSYSLRQGTTATIVIAPKIVTRITATTSSSSQTLPYLKIIQNVAATYQLSPELIKAIIKVESNYNPQAISPKGARGLMQLMPSTAQRFGVADVFDPEDNITGGVKFLRYLLDEFGEHNLELVLAGYNAGEEAVRKYDNQIPPYKETQQYVKRVLALFQPSGNTILTRATATPIYRYVNNDGVVTFSNVAKVR